MTELPRNLATLRLNGLRPDPDPSEVSPDTWTGGRNVLPVNGYMERVGGFSHVLTDNTVAGSTPLWHLNAERDGTAYWWAFTAGLNGVLVQDGSPTPPAGGLLVAATGIYPETASIEEFTGCLINNTPVFNNAGEEPWWWDYSSTTLTQFDTTDAATGPALKGAAVWSYKYHLFLGDVEVGGDSRPDQVWHSAAAEPGTVPGSWQPTATNDANFVELSDTRGRVVNGMQLGGSCLIMKERGAYLCTYTGGPLVMAYRNLSREAGIVCRHGMQVVQGTAYLFDDNTFLATDGQQITDVAETWLKREFFGNLNTDEIDRAFVAYDRPNQTIWFAAPMETNRYCSHAAIWDLTTQKWGFRELGEGDFSNQGFRYMRPGVLKEDSTVEPWTAATTDWTNRTGAWKSGALSANQDISMALCCDDDSVAEQTFWTEMDTQATTADGKAITGYLRRYQLDVGKQDEVKMVRAVHLHADDAMSLQCRVGGQYTHSDAIRWSPFFSLDATQTQKASVTATGRLISVEIKSDEPFNLPGFTLEAELRGRY